MLVDSFKEEIEVQCSAIIDLKHLHFRVDFRSKKFLFKICVRSCLKLSENSLSIQWKKKSIFPSLKSDNLRRATVVTHETTLKLFYCNLIDNKATHNSSLCNWKEDMNSRAKKICYTKRNVWAILDRRLSSWQPIQNILYGNKRNFTSVMIKLFLQRWDESTRLLHVRSYYANLFRKIIERWFYFFN